MRPYQGRGKARAQVFFLYYALWILLNGRMSGDVLLTGLPVCALVYLFTWKIAGLVPKREQTLLRRIPALAGYSVCLVREIVRANMQVLRLVFALDREVEPRLVPVRTDLREEGLRVILANSITLTPGTITVQMHGGGLLVHALDSSTAEGLEDTVFERRLKEMEGDGE